MSDLPIETVPTQRLARWHTSSFELAVALSLLAWFWFELARAPEAIADPLLLEWVVAILVVDLLPVPSTVGLPFSLSFPLQLSVALLYPPRGGRLRGAAREHRLARVPRGGPAAARPCSTGRRSPGPW